ncbi:aldolase/citrate lyase family protein [Roseomonas sp. OT10]|uniref:HpcH/HpaI aldolase family protein n=1 Tax=Roseomonas cutis TaxID=2897332 RepID=UPI001E30A59E|nr:aldolase/citrate lyase family protein [Roseomonas sp. OT10]UFN47635.1 aldolase/citrate lyase family protein [Roseomonas sp. OT10]
MDIPENRLKTRIRQGQPCFGMWVQSGNPTMAEIAGLVGLDFIIIDQEHGPGGVQDAMQMLRALNGSPTTGMIRVPAGDPVYLKRIVDAGAQALLVPMVDTAEEARAVVDACLYPPIGRRGNAAGVVRGSRFGLIGDYVARAHEQMLIVPQIETVKAVENAEAIASVPGVDMVFIGPSDLSGSAGFPGETGHPEVEALIARAAEGVRAVGKPLSTVPRDGRSWQDLFAEGYAAVASGSDIAIVRAAAAAQGEEWHRWREARRGA